MKEVGIWIRVSTEDQAKGESPENHERRAQMYAEAKGWKVVKVYHLEAVSGKSVKNHPEAKQMLQDIKEGVITGLIFSKLARLARNTRELLDFADIFRDHKADLVSLQESIDTSSPAGRFFYTLIAAMAEWEREEIADRVKASVAVRAKHGKSLGGEAPYGYKWDNKKLIIDENEASVRKLMYQLFLQKKRILTVAKELNSLGHRTRRGSKFSGTTVRRLLEDPIAKGMRRVNYTQSLGEGKHWKYKPEEDWEFQSTPAIISEETWEECNEILSELNSKFKKKRRSGIHLFTSIAKCTCGNKMYMRSKSPRYVCYNCGNKILPDDLEYIFKEQLKSFIFSDSQIEQHLNKEKKKIIDLEECLKVHQNKRQELKAKIQDLLNLYHEGQIEKSAFKGYHDPLYNELKQHEESIAEIHSHIDNAKMNSLSNDQVIHDARDLHQHWDSFTKDDKRKIIEGITENIIIGDEDIEINLNYVPTIAHDITEQEIENNEPPEDNLNSPALFLPFKLVQLFNTRMSLRLL